MDKEVIEIINELSTIKTKYKLLVDYLINNSNLSYNNKELRTNDCSNLLQSLEHEKYNVRLDYLQELNKTNE